MGGREARFDRGGWRDPWMGGKLWQHHIRTLMYIVVVLCAHNNTYGSVRIRSRTTEAMSYLVCWTGLELKLMRNARVTNLIMPRHDERIVCCTGYVRWFLMHTAEAY